jgi:hypothetical protein
MAVLNFMKKLSHFVPTRDLRYLLHDFLNQKEPHRGIANVHASEATKEGFCPRYYALMDTTAAKLPGQWVNTSEQVTFHIGRVLQDAIVNWSADMGKAVGHWKCLGCSKLEEFQKRPTKCTKCGCRAFKPEEVRFMSAVSGISGGIDMLIDLGNPLLRVVEIKTMDKDIFKLLAAPLAEHRQRTALYLQLIAESKHPWAKRIDKANADVIYVSKGGYGVADPELKKWGMVEQFSPFKRYTVSIKDVDNTEICRVAKVVKDFRAGHVGMPDGICATAVTKRAKECSACKACFSGDYPATYWWQEK